MASPSTIAGMIVTGLSVTRWKMCWTYSVATQISSTRSMLGRKSQGSSGSSQYQLAMAYDLRPCGCTTSSGSRENSFVFS